METYILPLQKCLNVLEVESNILNPPKLSHFALWCSVLLRDIKTQLFILGNLNGKTYYFRFGILFSYL